MIGGAKAALVSLSGSRAARERGVATIEFAIAAPLLIFLIFAVSEIGRAFVQYTILANSIRDASRYVAARALLGTTGQVSISEALRIQTQNLAVYGNPVGMGSPVLPRYAPSQVMVVDAGENNVSVSVTYPYQSMFGGQLPNLGFRSGSTSTAFNMQITVTMRAL